MTKENETSEAREKSGRSERHDRGEGTAMEGEREIFKTEKKWEKSLLSPTHTHKKKKKEQIKRAETAR